ncbi:YqcI/YcgG family protein [Yinghuangia sp. ASG 101]|uniref:YqcI/YcgG family protein n=1 Tax=Yinghuangia sp. ASG 101 TaxID=2896848 RepID=UPI001E586952|nr:YqcI/YcgG family protein [Yinghuangia sp. ASG 101]UGQ15272.1 YqcI/YcgG family protein [Yinghuangia sp. ASG 101]
MTRSDDAATNRPPPEPAPCLARFAAVARGTHCVYAPSSRLWGSPAWDPAGTAHDNLDATLPVLCDFVDRSRAEQLDGFVIELAGPRFGRDVPSLARSTHAVLRHLSDHDPAGERSLDREIETLPWCFAFGGEPMFVNTFAPCYPPAHSRHAFGAEHTYVVLQPRHSFGRVLRPGETVLPPAVRERIRADYARHDRAYDPRISSHPHEAWRVVRPLAGTRPVRWWETPAVFP